MGTEIPTEMIERVAGVLLRELAGGAASGAEMPSAFAENLARDVIEAMKEPTKGMIDAGEYELMDWQDTTTDSFGNSCTDISSGACRAVYQAMLDKAR